MADVFEVRRVEDMDLWDRLVRGARGGTIFSGSAWLRCASEAVGGSPLMLGCYRNGRLVGGCGLLEMRRYGISKAATPPLTPYGGFVYLTGETLKGVREEAERERVFTVLMDKLESDYSYVQISHAPGIVDVRHFGWRGWSTSVRYTYLVDMSGPEALWRSFEGRTRNAINKADRRGFRVREMDNVELFLRLYRMVYAKQGMAMPLGADAVGRLYSSVRRRGLCRMYLAESPAGDPASAVVFVLGFDTLYAWIGGADPAFNASGANSLLYWEVLKAMSGEFPLFDFVGANIPSIAKFKRGFGGRLVPYYSNERFASGLVRLAIGAYPLLRRALRRLPGKG